MKGWRQALYVFLICLPALLMVGIGAVMTAREVPGAIRYEPRRIGNLYRDAAEDLVTNAVAAVSVARQKGWRQRGKIDGVPWGYVVRGAKTTVWLQDGKGRCRTREVATVDPFPFALVFYGGGALVAAALLSLSALLAYGFLRYLRARDDFLAATAHDLTTPLVGMRLTIGRSDEEAKNLVERMLLVVNNLKDFLKLGGRRPPELKPTDLVARTKEAYSLFAADYADSAGGEVTMADVDGQMMVMADETMLMQILWNLFGNDLKYAAPYGKVAVKFRREGNLAVVEFVDEGQGMTPYQMRHAFARYYRAKTVLESGKGGFGIGLCTARDFARTMGGELSVRANDPKGCIFTLRLKEKTR